MSTKALTKQEAPPEPSGGLAQLVGEGHAIVRIENDTLQQIAITRPRPSVEAILKDAVKELEAVPEFASLAFYAIPYRERKDDAEAEVKLVEGPSVKAAHTLVRMYRNTSSGNRIVGEDENFVYTQGVMIDLETNTRKLVNRRTGRRAWNKRTQSMYVLSADRLNTAVGADASKAERNAILNLLPPSLVIPYVKRAKELAAQFKTGKPKEKPASAADRWARAVAKFAEFGVKEEQLTALLATVNPENSLDEKIGTLIGVYNAIKDGQTTVEETFGRKEVPEVSLVDQLFPQSANKPVVPSAPPAPEAEPEPEPPGHLEFDGEIANDAEAARLTQLRQDIIEIIRQLVPEFPVMSKPERTKITKTLMLRAFKTIEDISAIDEVLVKDVEPGIKKLRADVNAALSTRGGKPI